jgi:hypothetical protein
MLREPRNDAAPAPVLSLTGIGSAARARVPRVFALAPLLLALLAPVGRPTYAHAIVAVAANQSYNWAGYVQGALEKDGTLFHAITADWIVPTVTQRRAGEAEYSSTWIGIGGGCVTEDCDVTDATLIQAGIGHDVDAAGNADYYAWWEAIPLPSVRIEGFVVGAGDRVHVDIAEDAVTKEVWTINVRDLTSGSSFTMTLPYTSTYATAEWVLETPVVIDEQGTIFSVGPLPNVSTVHFDRGTTNGANAALVESEEMQLLDFYGSGVIALPSRPEKDTDGFNDCSFTKVCQRPNKELP